MLIPSNVRHCISAQQFNPTMLEQDAPPLARQTLRSYPPQHQQFSQSYAAQLTAHDARGLKAYSKERSYSATTTTEVHTPLR